ncbi:hypothetical protein Tco_0728041 [Tanacetum coccineum]|uniref:Uncharacterized protein n=1 Tax=Tanacetum coccineum TaxID=301880 RepID=A0ABQ4YMD4_9ASTR
MDEDIAMLFGNDEFGDDDSEGFDEEEVWECLRGWRPSTAAAEGPSFPLPTPEIPVPPSVIKDLSTRLGNMEYGHGQLVKKMIQVSDAEVAAGVSIKEIGPRVFAIEGPALLWQQSVSHIQQLQTTVTEMRSRESTLMQCILGMDRQLAELERRPPGPQFLRWVEAKINRPEDEKMRNGEDFSYIRCVLPLMYQLMAVKKTSFPETESSGSVVVNVPEIVED